MDFISSIQQSFQFIGSKIILGLPAYDGKIYADTPVYLPLSTLNRHGLISGATGTGKTITLQMMSEQLSRSGVPVVMMDLKGDLSGLANEGVSSNSIEERKLKLGKHYPFRFDNFPVNFFSLGKNAGIPLRAELQDFGSVLISRILNLNSVQRGVISVVFKYCSEHNLKIHTLRDLRFALNQICRDDEQIEEHYGAISQASVAAILRSVSELEEQGADKFIAAPAFDIHDFLRFDESGKAFISIIGLSKMQDRPALFSTFILYLLTTIYELMPEVGDLNKPKLVLLIDEAHLLFEESGNAVESKIENIVKLIRSKGIAIVFCTQTPLDIPSSVVAQLGFKIQHALRAFTPKDRKAIKQMAENFPVTPFYSLENEITELPIGEAFVTVLNEKGVPTPVVRTWMAPPVSKIGTIGEDRIENLVSSSVLFKKYSPPSTIHSEVNPQLISFHKALLERQNRKHEELKRAKDEEKQLSKKPKKTTAKIAGRDGVNPLMQAYANMMGFTSSQNNAQPPGNFNTPIQYYFSVDGTRKGPYQAEEIDNWLPMG